MPVFSDCFPGWLQPPYPLAVAVLDRAQHLTRWLTDPRLSRSYYPSEPHKSKARILAELAWSRL
jgi:hypothetical protein